MIEILQSPTVTTITATVILIVFVYLNDRENARIREEKAHMHQLLSKINENIEQVYSRLNRINEKL